MELKPTNSERFGYWITVGYIGEKPPYEELEKYTGKPIVLYVDELGTVGQAAQFDKYAKHLLESQRKHGIDVSKKPFFKGYEFMQYKKIKTE